MIGCEIIAIDGTKSRAHNSKKATFNQKKIERHLEYIEERTPEYLAVFIVQGVGIHLDLTTQLIIVVAATLASIGSAAVPSAGMVMLVIVLGQAAIAEAGLALIFAIDRPVDMCRTVVNVTSDSAVSAIVGNLVGKLRNPEDIMERKLCST